MLVGCAFFDQCRKARRLCSQFQEFRIIKNHSGFAASFSRKRSAIYNIIIKAALVQFSVWSLAGCGDHGITTSQASAAPPNFVFILSDDQSWLHTSFSGYPLINTPNFDRIAREGVYFTTTYATAPSCTPSRSSILAGQPIWRLGSGANLWGEYPPQMINFQGILKKAGYRVGATGKTWGPGYVAPEVDPPSGPRYNKILRAVPEWIGTIDYPANFETFLEQVPPGTPFSFWLGSIEPHRDYNPAPTDRFEDESSRRYLPGTMPASTEVRLQFSAYLEEIEYFDQDVGRILAILEERNLLENTVVIVTSDNGMPFPRGKTNNYEYGVRVPLAILGGSPVNGGRVVDDFVSLQDIAPTLLELAGASIPQEITGTSLRYALVSDQSGVIDAERDASFTAFERHGGFIRGGEQNLTYPRRAIHTKKFVYIKNYHAERWPVGDPPRHGEAYKDLLIDNWSKSPIEPYFSLAVEKRPAEELFDIELDPYQLDNLAEKPEFIEIKNVLARRLQAELVATGDPLEILHRDIFQDFKYWKPPADS